MKFKYLKLIAKTTDDLKVISAHLQDSIVSTKDIANLKKNRNYYGKKSYGFYMEKKYSSSTGKYESF